jgi:opacity protein-like surface antigen
MKRLISAFTVVILLGGLTSVLQAQSDISSIFKAGVADLNKVANGYLTPAGNCFSAGLATNWYNTAEVHKPFGFDLTVGAGVVQAPTTDQMFSLVGLTNLKPNDPTITQAPTFAGSGSGVELNLMQPHYLADGSTVNPLWNNGTGKITSFTTPGGLSQYIPTASVQLTIGLPFINDVSVRFIPKVSVSGFETSMWGIGIKHNFKQWIPVVKDLPFDASVLLAYNKFDLKYAFPTSAQITPATLVGTSLAYEPTTTDYTTQGMNISANAMTANIIVSKKLAFFTPYFGFGVSKMAGNYPLLGNPKTQVVNIGGTNQTIPVVDANNKPIMLIDNMTDPIKISSNEVMANATVGFRLKILWVLALHAQYTFQKYPTASVGFGINIR